MIPLGKGYFEFSFSSAEDLHSVWTIGTWNLNPGLLRLSQWVADFNPKSQRQTHMQCWLRIHDLPQEYWRPRILFEIATGVGTPISLDEPTRARSLGHFARILVDLDLTARLPVEILVERDNFAFYVGIEYEKYLNSVSTVKLLVTRLAYAGKRGEIVMLLQTTLSLELNQPLNLSPKWFKKEMKQLLK